jgi:hypothetical protein
MDSIVDNTSMVDTGTSIEDDIFPDAAGGIDDRSGRDDSSPTDPGVGGDDGLWMNGGGQVKSFCENLAGQEKAFGAIPKAKNQMPDTLLQENIQLLLSAQDRQTA